MMRTESVPAKQNGLPLCWTEISVCILWLRVLLCLVERNGWHATHFRQVVRTAGLHEFRWWERNPSQPSRMDPEPFLASLQLCISLLATCQNHLLLWIYGCHNGTTLPSDALVPWIIFPSNVNRERRYPPLNQAFWEGRLLLGKAMIQKIEWSQTPLSKQEVLHMIAFRCAALGAHGRFSAYTKCSWISRWHSFLLISQLLGVVFFSHESHRCSPICFQIYLSKSRYHVELHHPPGWKNILNWNLEKNLSNTSMIARGFPWFPTSHTLPISGRCSWSSVSVLPPL